MRYEFFSKLDYNFKGNYASFIQRKRYDSNGIYFDSRSYINKNQEKWLKSLEEWHSNLCEIGAEITPLWWLIEGSRFYTWSPPIFSPYIFAVAIKKYCSDLKIEAMALLDCPREVYIYLKEMDSEAEFVLQENIKLKQFNIATYQKRIFKNVLRLTLAFFKSFRFITFRQRKFNSEILIFSQLFDISDANNSIDHYYGDVFTSYEIRNRGHVLWVFQDNIKFILNNSYKKILNNKNYVLIQQFNNPFDIIKILLTYLKLINYYVLIARKLPSFTIDSIKSKILPRDYFSFLVNGILPLHELLIFNAFSKIIKNYSKIRVIVYPYEEKTIERAILLARENSREIVAVGYSHSVHWNLHYYYHVRQNHLSNSPRPDIYAVTGTLEKWWLKNIADVPVQKIKVLGSSRYVNRRHPKKSFCDYYNNMKVLITVGQSSDLNILANYLEEEPDIFSECDLIIRKYPYAWDYDQEIGISRINNYVDTFKVNNKQSLDSQIEWCDITIYNTSSCGIIAMLSGRIAINVALHNMFYWDPLEKDGSKNAVIHCRSAFELKNTINKLKVIKPEKYNEIQEKQYSYAENVYSPVNNNVVQELLNLRKM